MVPITIIKKALGTTLAMMIIVCLLILPFLIVVDFIISSGVVGGDIDDGVHDSGEVDRAVDKEVIMFIAEQCAMFESCSHIQLINARTRMYKEETLPHPLIPLETMPTR
ncbi:unnamed protein product [Rotaria socialis]|uniref:Uncharacterized protein n=1 Tax=Rotaria socialis TaxID=392032 RepID=A0A817Y4H4_9BILA|nr:unnamed protein product [Rotaria socialis]CAF3375933.1 unnamed protein product [Rotaria socialis]CAF4326260.1 unnamed protein product [Rotaria socialis]CAF4449475.1 unnamed protein product [Rotaria socialis]CAF4477751.1 unnamed protein product [Rotaria socialis]